MASNDSDIKSENVNMNSEESNGSNLEDDDDEIIDLDQEVEESPAILVQDVQEDNKQEDIQVARSPVATQQIMSTEIHTEQTKKKNPQSTGEFFSPKNNKTIGKIFLNTTSNLVTEENQQNGEHLRTEQNKTVLSKLAEDFGKKSLIGEGAKVSFYEFLLHDVHIQKYIDKHNLDNLEKVNSFITRNKEFLAKKNMKLKEKIEKFQEEVSVVCHGKPNNKDFNPDQIRPPDQFLSDNYNFVAKKQEKINQIRTKIIEETNKAVLPCPVISKKTKQLAEKKHGADKQVHQRLFADKGKKQKKNAFQNDNDKLQAPDMLKDKKKDPKEIQKNVEKLYQDAKDRKKRKEEETPAAYEEPYDRDNIASESSKYLILEKFVKSFELCLLNLFNVKDNHMANYEQYATMLYTLGFVKFDPNNRTFAVEEDKKNVPGRLKQRESSKSSGRRTISRGRSESSLDRTFKKVDNESKIIKESWKFLSKDQEKVNTDQILVFLSGILGLYDGEKPEDSKPVTNIKAESSRKQAGIKESTKKEDKRSNSLSKSTQFENRLSRKKEKSLAKSEVRDQTKSPGSDERVKKNEILLKKVVPELNLQQFSYSFKVVQYLKFFFRYFYDNRMNYLLHTNRKLKSAAQNEDLVFKPQLNKKTIQSAEIYRKKCIDQIKQDYHPEGTEQNGLKKSEIRLEEVYNILKQKKENEIAKLKLQQAEEEIKQCTFQPNIEKRSSTYENKEESPKGFNQTNQVEVAKKLYSEAQQKQLKLKNLEENKKDPEWEKHQTECTFSPKYISKLNASIFQNNPIQDDEQTKKKIESMEKTRIEKKLQDYKYNKGLNKIGKNVDVDSIIKDQSLPTWKYGIEQKTHKDTFEVRKKENKSANLTNSYMKRISMLNTLQSHQNTDENTEMNLSPIISKRNPFLVLDVNIRDDFSQRLEIQDAESALQVCDEFCERNQLGEERKQFLYNLVNQRLGESR